MISKLSSIPILAALTIAATAQTATQKPATTTTHHATTAAKATTPNIPRVIGVPKTIYALKYIDTKIGTGPVAESSEIGTSMADSKIKWYTVRYTGWLANGTKFDSSYDHPGGEPITFPQGAHRVIPGWDTGFQGMHIGGKRRLFIPYQLAYGEAGRPPHIPAKSELIFDIELVSVSDNPPAPPTPPTPPEPAKPSETAPNPATPPTPKPADTPPAPPTPKTPTNPQGV